MCQGGHHGLTSGKEAEFAKPEPRFSHVHQGFIAGPDSRNEVNLALEHREQSLRGAAFGTDDLALVVGAHPGSRDDQFTQRQWQASEPAALAEAIDESLLRVSVHR